MLEYYTNQNGNCVLLLMRLKRINKKKKSSPNTKAKITLPFTPSPIRKNSRKMSSKRQKKKFKNNRGKNKSGSKRKNRKTIILLLRYFLLLLILIGIGYVAYFAVSKIFDLRSARNQDKIDISASIIGISNIPVYPNSEFIFQNLLDDESVQKTLTNGISAYRLPPGNDIEDAFQFYKEHLPTLNWEFIQDVPLNSHEMMFGQYWTNQDGTSVRIYSRLNDIWYETITHEEAKTGLSKRKEESIVREQILNAEEIQQLLPGFPWALEVPGDYILDYFATDSSDAVGVTFTQMVSKEKTIFVPIGETNSKPEDLLLDQYISKYNILESTVDKLDILNTKYIREFSKDMLQVDFRSGKTGYVLRNKLDNLSYLLFSDSKSTTFIDYVRENVVDKSILSPSFQLQIYD